MRTTQKLRELTTLAGYYSDDFVAEWISFSKACPGKSGFEDISDWWELSLKEKARIRKDRLYLFANHLTDEGSENANT